MASCISGARSQQSGFRRQSSSETTPIDHERTVRDPRVWKRIEESSFDVNPRTTMPESWKKHGISCQLLESEDGFPCDLDQ